MFAAQLKQKLSYNRKYVNLFKIPISSGQPHDGVRFAPSVIETHIQTKLQNKYNVRSINVEPICPIEYSNTYLTLLQHGQSDKNVFLGGDHSMSIASALAFNTLNKNENPGMIWIDAHADINTQHMSLSKNTHGMSVAYIIGMEQLPWITKYMNYKNIVYIGLRDLDPFEIKMLDQLQIRSFSSQFVHQHGMKTTMLLALEHLQKCQKLHVSFDVDVTNFIKGTGTYVPGGITEEHTQHAANIIQNCPKINSIDFVEYNPTLSEDKYENKRVSNMILNFI